MKPALPQNAENGLDRLQCFDLSSDQKMLQEGLDEIGITLELEAAIAAHEAKARADTPWVEGAAKAA